MKKIIVAGSANMDYYINVEHMPRLGETITGKGFSVNAGGKGLNQAVAIAKLGGEVSCVGAVGCDANGKILLEALDEYGVVFDGIKTENSATGVAFVTITNGDNFIVLDSGANDLLIPQTIESKYEQIAYADYIVLQLEIPTETVKRAIEIAKENNTKVVLNPAPYKELPEELLPLIDILVPNEHEAEAMTGIELSNKRNCIRAIEKLKGKGIKTVIITLGDRGCVYNNENEIVFCNALEVETIDTTSAGDSFIGALCVKLANDEALSDAVAFATKVSAITVSRKGAAVSIPYISELKF